ETTQRSRLVALAVTFASGIIVVTCNTGREHALPPPASPAPLPPMEPTALATTPASPESAAPIAAASPDAPLDDPGPRAAAEPQAPSGPGRELARFYAALRSLEKHTRAEHVRVVWLGDSHGAADYWSGALRTALQKRFGNGGPGFVHIGYRGYRHDG